jgi:predicted MFS family arabinose efflux permease
MVIVNSVVIVRNTFGFGQREVALSLAAYGGGSMLAALALPRLLDRIEGRTVMLGGAAVLTAALAALGLASGGMTATFWPVLLAGWFVLERPMRRPLRHRGCCSDARLRPKIDPPFSQRNSRLAMPAG